MLKMTIIYCGLFVVQLEFQSQGLVSDSRLIYIRIAKQNTTNFVSTLFFVDSTTAKSDLTAKYVSVVIQFAYQVRQKF